MHLEITDTRTLTDENPKVTALEFHGTPVSIGSHSANLVQLPDMEVLDYHAMLLPVGDEGEEWVYQPTKPTAAAEVNGTPVVGPVALEDGDVLTITHYEIRFTLDQKPDLELPEASNVEELAKIRQFPLPSRAEVRKGDEDILLTPSLQDTLAQFGLRLRTCTDFAQLLEATLGFLLPQLGARTVWMGVRREPTGRLEFVAGKSDKGPYNGEPWNLECYTYRCLTRHQYIRIPKTGQEETQSSMAVPIIGKRGPLGLLVADTRRRTRVFDQSDHDFLTIVARFVASQLEAIIDNIAAIRSQIAGGELAFLREVQSRLDPKHVPLWPQIQLAAYAKPGSTASGDFYDISRLPNGLAAFLIGHAAAGMNRTALAMTDVRTAFRVAGLHADPPQVQMKVYNWLILDEKEPCRLDAAVVIMNPKTGAFEYSTAGNMGLVAIDGNGEPRDLNTPGSPPVGTQKGFEYAVAKDRLKDGEMLALFSAGCTTAANQAGEPLGRERFLSAICDNVGQTPSEIITDLTTDLQSYIKSGKVAEDFTLLLMRRDGTGS